MAYKGIKLWYFNAVIVKTTTLRYEISSENGKSTSLPAALFLFFSSQNPIPHTMTHFSPSFIFRKRFRSFWMLALLLLGLENQSAHAQKVVLQGFW